MPIALSRHRKARNINQTDLAAMLGCHQTNISQWERGICRPHRRHREPLERLFGVALSELFQNDEDPVSGASANADSGTAKNRELHHAE